MKKYEKLETRKQFEQWAELHKFVITLDETVIHEDYPIYARPFTQGAWMSWCAALDSSQQ